MSRQKVRQTLYFEANLLQKINELGAAEGKKNSDMVALLVSEAIAARGQENINPILLELKNVVREESEDLKKTFNQQINRVADLLAKNSKYVFVIRHLLQNYMKTYFRIVNHPELAEKTDVSANNLWEKSRTFFNDLKGE